MEIETDKQFPFLVRFISNIDDFTIRFFNIDVYRIFIIKLY